VCFSSFSFLDVFFLDYRWGEAGRREDRTYVSWTDDGTVPV